MVIKSFYLSTVDFSRFNANINFTSQAQQGCRHSIRDLQKGHDPAQNVGNAYKEHHHAGHLGRVHEDLPQALQVDGAVAEGKDQRIGNGNGRAFGGREHTADDAADDHDDHRTVKNIPFQKCFQRGDINGVGYEVILKTFSDPTMLELCTPIIYGSPKVAAYHRKALLS